MNNPTSTPLRFPDDTWVPPSWVLAPVGWLPFGDGSGGMWYLAAVAGLSLEHLDRGVLALVPCAYLAPHLDWSFDEARLLDLGSAARDGKRAPRVTMAELLERPRADRPPEPDSPRRAASLGTDELRRGPRAIPADLVAAFRAELDTAEAQAGAWPEDPTPELHALRRAAPWQLLAPSAVLACRRFLAAPAALSDLDVAVLAVVALAKQGAPGGVRRTGRRRALPAADHETSLIRVLLALQERDATFPARAVYAEVSGANSVWSRAREKAGRGDVRVRDERLGAVAVPFPAEVCEPTQRWPEYEQDLAALRACHRAVKRGEFGSVRQQAPALPPAWARYSSEQLMRWVESREFAMDLILIAGGAPGGLVRVNR